MISKELLRDCQDYKINIARISTVDYNNHLLYEFENGDQERINIHELDHKCKKWAFNKGYYIDLNLSKECVTVELYDSSDVKCNRIFPMQFNREFNTEPEAIFKACEWILDNAN